MHIPFLHLGLFASILALAFSAQAQGNAISDGAVRIGVITDMSGALSELAGRGSATAVRMAVEDFGGKVLGRPIEVLEADHQNKADIAANKVREWIDVRNMDMVTDLTNSAVALAVVDMVKQKNKIAIINGAGSLRLTNENCTPNSIHYAWDTYAMANGTGKAILKTGGDSWYFLTADYAYGHQIERDVTEVVTSAGGKVVGTSRHPFNSHDFSSFMISAQSSGAKIIGIASGGADAINAIKSAQEFGINPAKQSIAGLSLFITEVNSLGLKTAHGVLLTEGFYWDTDEETRKWSRRYFERMKKMPTVIHAANYSSTMHYLQAVRDSGTDATDVVMAKMKATKVNDFFARNGTIREDGRMTHDVYLMQVKKPDESKYPWDYYKQVAVIPAAEAFQPLEKSTCPMVKKAKS